MTDTTEPQTAEIETEEYQEVAAPPFLRIRATYPAPDDQYHSVDLEINLGDEQTVAYEDTDTGQIRSWLTDFCVQVIGALRYRQAPSTLTVNNAGRPDNLPADRPDWHFGLKGGE
jgi:hypothetical protein